MYEPGPLNFCSYLYTRLFLWKKKKKTIQCCNQRLKLNGTKNQPKEEWQLMSGFTFTFTFTPTQLLVINCSENNITWLNTYVNHCSSCSSFCRLIIHHTIFMYVYSDSLILPLTLIPFKTGNRNYIKWISHIMCQKIKPSLIFECGGWVAGVVQPEDRWCSVVWWCGSGCLFIACQTAAGWAGRRGVGCCLSVSSCSLCATHTSRTIQKHELLCSVQIEVSSIFNCPKWGNRFVFAVARRKSDSMEINV